MRRLSKILTFTEDKGEIVPSIQLKTHVGEDGLLKVQMPPEIKDMELDVMVVFQPSSNEEQLRCNAWGKPITRQSIQQTIAGMKQLRQQIAIDKDSLRSMREEGRRF